MSKQHLHRQLSKAYRELIALAYHPESKEAGIAGEIIAIQTLIQSCVERLEKLGVESEIPQ